MFFIVFTRARC